MASAGVWHIAAAYRWTHSQDCHLSSR